MWMGYRIAYGGSSGRMKPLVVALLLLIFFVFGWIWKEKIIIFLLFPGKEIVGQQILSEALSFYKQEYGIGKAAALLIERCKCG